MGVVRVTCEPGVEVSDGYHTFGELYAHRIELFIALARVLEGDEEVDVWRSKRHSDATMFEGWFVLGIGRRTGTQITYHLPMARWDDTDFAETLQLAPPFDGHTSEDVLKRLAAL